MIVLAMVGFAAAVWWFTSTKVLFKVSIRNGKCLLVHGRIPHGFWNDIVDLVQREGIVRGTISGIAGETRARLSMNGINVNMDQRLRNLFALYPMSAMRSAPAIRKPTLGQLTGIAWLAWLLEPRE